MIWGVIQDRYVVNGAFPTVVCSGLHVVQNVWAVKEVFGRTPEADKTQMGGFPGLESSDREGFVGSSCLCGCGWIERVWLNWCTPEGQIFSRSRGVRGYGRAW